MEHVYNWSELYSDCDTIKHYSRSVHNNKSHERLSLSTKKGVRMLVKNDPCHKKWLGVDGSENGLGFVLLHGLHGVPDSLEPCAKSKQEICDWVTSLNTQKVIERATTGTGMGVGMCKNLFNCHTGFGV